MDAPNRIWTDWKSANYACVAFDEPPASDAEGFRTEYILAAEHDRIVAEKDARIAELEERLRDLLAPFEDDPCRYDHHGYCQTHFIEPGDQCCVKLARAALNGDDNG